MDIEFDTLVEDVDASENATLGSPHSALAYFDNEWYLKRSRRARRMDLIGDYAGSEMFVIDGDSLLQIVLDDPLLALARQSDPSFQILHAIHNVEQLLGEFLKRGAEFRIVFFEDSRHATLRTGCHELTFASRALARTMLLRHLRTLQVPVHTFAGIDDAHWRRFVLLSKPMFIMLNDGGSVEDNTATSAFIVERILGQRIRLFEFITRGLSCALLRGTVFRDSKIMSFVYEQRSDPDARKQVPSKFWQLASAANQNLDQLERECRARLLPNPSPSSPSVESIDQFLQIARQNLTIHDRSCCLALYVFTAHLLLLPSISVKERGRPLRTVSPSLTELLSDTFLPVAYLSYAATNELHSAMDVDGRVFVEMIYFFLANPRLSPAHVLGDETAAKLEGLWKEHNMPAVDVLSVAAQYPSLENYDIESTTTATLAPPLALLPFSNPVFDTALANAHVTIGSSASKHAGKDAAEMDFNTVFRDAQHWHNHRRALLPKHLGGEDKAPALTEWQRKRQLRSEQRFTAKLQWQAESLTGASGKALQQMTIVPSPAVATKPIRNPSQVAPEKPKKKEKKVHVSKAEQIRQQNAARKLDTQDESNEVWWKDQLAKMDGRSTAERLAITDRLLGNATRADTGWLAVEMRLYRLHLEFKAWAEHPDADAEDAAAQAAARDKYSVSTVRMVKELAERGGLFPAACKALESALSCLGLAEYIPALINASPNTSDNPRKLAFSFVKLVRSKTKAPVYAFMALTEDPVVWQLRLFGEYMDRSMDSQPDSRVSFQPDAWQRRVLDCLDDVDEENDVNHSVLVVAPTSAGKTFISYYAMEQVLRRSDDEILVYVAPTKALVSQIAAEVYARFNKSYKTVGRSLWAIHTRDYRVHNPQNCQILVTVPEMLAIMLLSPQLSRVWTPRIKRIILDEIHSIGQQEGGAVWEQIILLAPCPIIGLSATIGEAEKFNAWLGSVQKAHGFRHTFINHPHRYSHLRKFNYVMQHRPESAFAGTDTYVNTNRSRFLHPVSLLSFGAHALPSDFSLESADCLSLYRALLAMNADDSILRGLDPTRFFGRGRLLKQKDILNYEEVLKEKLAVIISASDPQEMASPLNQLVKKLQDPMTSKLSDAQLNAAPPVKVFLDNLLYLVCDLNAQGDLPAIMFNFDRSGCEIATKTLLAALESAEAAWRRTSPEWQRKIERWETWKAQAPAREKAAEKLRRQRKDPDEPVNHAPDSSWESSFDPDDPSPQFSFLGKKCSKAILNEAIEDIRWTTTPEWAKDALRRGIGIHHAGMNKHYRTAVESLYRMGYIQVVIATGTLALGINAPTKTSVFCGDSPFLTALMYRQCAGRAGRRGFDLLGKVVFYGLPMDRVQRLVLSRLPSIGGNFPLTSTMVLRLFNLLQGSDYSPVAVKAIKSLLELPQISFVFETGTRELLHHVRFSIEYLRRSGLLDVDGNPINLFGLAAHLYYTEPSNFALVTLMRRGVIHDICNQKKVEHAKRDLLILLCHLFGRRFLPAVYGSEQHARAVHRKSPSIVLLPPMPKAAKDVLLQHDAEIMRIFTAYAIAFATQTQRSPDAPDDSQYLPLSQRRVQGQPTTSLFRDHLQQTCLEVTARSPFVANSGHCDHFESVAELAQTCRRDLHLREHGVPSMHQFTATPTTGNDVLPLNAYLLDFWTHGQPAALVTANGIRRGELWYLLEDFSLTLKTVRSTVEHLLLRTGPAESDFDAGPPDGSTTVRPAGVSDRDWKVFEVVDHITAEFDEKFRAMWA